MKHTIITTLLLSCILTACNSVPPQDIKTLSAESLYYKGVQNLSGNGIPRDEAKALQYFKAASDKGYISADNAIAVMYDEGIAVKADKEIALQYYAKAAKSQDTAALYNLAAFYYENDPSNPKLQQYLEQAIDHKDGDALSLQARIQMRNGNLNEAYRLFAKAAKVQHPDALFYLYLMNKEGKGTRKNKNLSMTYLKKAAELRQPEALFILGTMYLQGDELPQDKPKAFDLLNKAAKAGHIKATVNLAIMYQKGDGIDQDLSKSIQLLKIAAAQGDQQAIQTLQTIK
ncbi:tetratricopeptide repeat protein [Wohlfahrtiimonas larvae]|uniref:Sel1 repeat family protein n=1 Tax=Wohlfahrtiimonas larvae TaxID=1157986 RepID=A0ABP9MX31_9GAMM|nr:tetratricopeptide repeat protein [Wohlfahrtiimonas larvae]